MEIYRDEHAQNFTTIYNQVARDSRLTWQASGLLLHLLSLPPEWHTTLEELAEARPNGLCSTKAAFQLLRKLGYARVYDERDERGHLHRKVKIYETPQEACNSTDVPLTERRKTDFRSDQGKRAVVAGSTESRFSEPRSTDPVVKDVHQRHTKDRGSTSSSPGPTQTAAHSQASAPDDDTKIRLVAQAVRYHYGDSIEDEDALRIWQRFLGERVTAAPVKDPVRYLGKIFADAPDIDSLLSNTPHLDDKDAWTCPRCEHTYPDCGSVGRCGVCVWCEDEVQHARAQ